MASGSVVFNETKTFFADNDLGEGATTTITVRPDCGMGYEMYVVLHWVAWNEFEFESIGAPDFALVNPEEAQDTTGQSVLGNSDEYK